MQVPEGEIFRHQGRRAVIAAEGSGCTRARQGNTSMVNPHESALLLPRPAVFLFEDRGGSGSTGTHLH